MYQVRFKLSFTYFLAIDDVDAMRCWSRHMSALQIIAFVVGCAGCFHFIDACRIHIVVLAVIIMTHMTSAIGIGLHALKQIVVGA